MEGVIDATRATREKIVYVCETGKAHTMGKVFSSFSSSENVIFTQLLELIDFCNPYGNSAY